jgi:hypothetical protein
MKKILAILLVAMFLTPVAAMAATHTLEVELGDGTTTEVISVLSNNVTLQHAGDATTYAAVTGHLNGSKIYGSSSQDTKIYSKAAEAPITVPAPGSSDSAAFSGWKAL